MLCCLLLTEHKIKALNFLKITNSFEHLQMLREYAGDNTENTRIVLLSDGIETEGITVAEVLPSIVDDGILIDTIIYG